MVGVENLSLTFGTRALFDNITFQFNDDMKVGLVGNNGTGKTTLLKIIAGQERYDHGTLLRSKNITLAYLPQHLTLESELTVTKEAFSAFAHAVKLQEELVRLQALEPSESTTDRIAILYHELSQAQPEKLQAQADQMLFELGFSNEQLNLPVSSLSVGWRMRLILAKLLLQKADFYLFDEPTNHLDIMTKSWFIDFLKNASFGFLLVSHDRFVLDQVCNSTLELERGKAILYQGNYSSYKRQKAERALAQDAAYKAQQAEIKRKKDTAQRFRAQATKAAMAQSILKSLEKIELLEPPAQPPKALNFSFPPSPACARVVLNVKNVAHYFGAKKLFKNVSFELERGQKIAIVAANGVGKSTLLYLISGKLKLLEGLITFGHGVRPAFFQQDQSAVLPSEKTIFQVVRESCVRQTDLEIRTLLGNFLFSADDIEKKIKYLSGGEKNRVGMACVLLQNANFLLLDEPTNHLDMISKDNLLQALKQCPASMLFVSHEVDFIDGLATHILELSPEQTKLYHGDYSSYLHQRAQAREISQALQKSPVPSSDQTKQVNISTRPNQYDVKVSENQHQRAKRIKSLERKIEALEMQIAQTNANLLNHEYGTSSYIKLAQELEALVAQEQALMIEWETT